MIRRILTAALLALFLLSAGGCKDEGDSLGMLPIAHKALEDTTSVFYGDYSEYPEDIASLPIGLADASTDGFCILEMFLTMDRFDNITGKMVPDGIADFGGENFQFLASQGDAPYRTYIEAGRKENLQELILRNAIFLMGRGYFNLTVDDFMSGVKEPVKCIIMASDAAAVTSASEVQEFIDRTETGVTLISVLPSAIRSMLSRMKPDQNYSIGILSPSGIITAKEYESTLRKRAVEAGKNGVIQVFNQEAAGLAEALKGNPDYIDPYRDSVRAGYKGPRLGISYKDIDITLMDRYNFDMTGNALLYRRQNGKYAEVQINSIGNYVRYHLVSLVERHRRSGSKIPISTILLSSNRYSQVKDTLDKVMDELYNFKRDGIYLYRNSIAEDFHFIDPVECAAVECYQQLREAGKLARRGFKTELQAFISVPSFHLPQECLDSTGALKDSVRVNRFMSAEEGLTKIVPFAPRYVEYRTMRFIEEYTPYTYSLIRNTLY